MCIIAFNFPKKFTTFFSHLVNIESRSQSSTLSVHRKQFLRTSTNELEQCQAIVHEIRKWFAHLECIIVGCFFWSGGCKQLAEKSPTRLRHGRVNIRASTNTQPLSMCRGDNEKVDVIRRMPCVRGSGSAGKQVSTLDVPPKCQINTYNIFFCPARFPLLLHRVHIFELRRNTKDDHLRRFCVFIDFSNL